MNRDQGLCTGPKDSDNMAVVPGPKFCPLVPMTRKSPWSYLHIVDTLTLCCATVTILGRNKDILKTLLCLSIWQTVETIDHEEVGISPGIACWEKEKALATRKELDSGKRSHPGNKLSEHCRMRLKPKH